MNIKRTIDTSKATYDIGGLDDEQFSFILQSLHHYCSYTMRHIPDDESTPLGNLMSKLNKMKNSSVTIIN